MVAAKYLCSAPHPDTWDERGEALLKSLGGDKAKRRRVIRETLASLDTENLVRKIPRPGRKTNAEHAIAFYRHVLALNEGEEESEEEEEESAEEAPKESKPRKQRASKRKRLGVGDDEGSKAGSVASMDSEEFRNQHNDLCEVCNGAGELVCCSTCNLVFHLQCIRPPTTRFPPDKWCCAYCVAAGVRGHTKEARTRRRAAAAAREMTRMKNELNPPDEESGEAKETDEEKEAKKRRGRPPKRIVETKETEETKDEKPKPRRGRPPKRSVETEETGEAKEGEPAAKRAKAEEGGCQPEETEEAAEGRTRRERRQPALYNPQAGAASTWQSDGKLEWKSLGKEQGASTDNETGDDNTSKGTGDESDSSEKTVLCNFCGDDPNISVCCFCACRTCFGKHDKSKLLICDNCDNEYHIYCLDPPLKSVPHAKSWFCASCKSSTNEEAKPAAQPKAEPKRRGRPPKKAPPALKDIPVLPKRRGRPPKKLTEDEESPPVVKKRRGRPPKKKPAPVAAKDPALSDTPVRSNVGKKRRGRPPKKKNLQATKTSTAAAASTGVAAAPGSKSLPANSSAGAAGMPLVTPQSNPGFNNAPSAANMQTFAGMVQANVPASGMNPQATAPPQKSRSGRTVKRNSFHDEIYEGSQHLRTSHPSLGQYKPASAGPPNAGGSQVISEGPSYQAFLQQTQNATMPNSALAQTVKPPSKIAGPRPVSQSFNAPGAAQVGAPAAASFAAPAAAMRPMATYTPAGMTPAQGSLPVPPAVLAYPSSVAHAPPLAAASASKAPRRKPGARECMQMSRRFGVKVIPQVYMDTLFDYCSRGKVEHLIRMRERLDEHSRMLEAQLAGLEALVKEKGELDITVPAAEPNDRSPPK